LLVTTWNIAYTNNDHCQRTGSKNIFMDEETSIKIKNNIIKQLLIKILSLFNHLQKTKGEQIR